MEQGMAIAGAIGIGLTAGWLVEARLTARRTAPAASAAVALALIALLVWRLSGAAALVAVACAALVGTVCSYTWHLALAQRRLHEAENNT
jgi:uncharacterized membrane protein